MRKNYQRKTRKSNHKFEVVGGQELLVRVPLPMPQRKKTSEQKSIMKLFRIRLSRFVISVVGLSMLVSTKLYC